MSLEKKTVLITGGSRGIGRGITELFAEKGARVFFTYSKDAQAAREAEQMGARGYLADARDAGGIKQAVSQIIKETGGIDVLVNNAGIRRDRSLLYMTPEDWADVMNVNLTSAFHASKAVIYYMLKQRSGRIINISSVSGISGLPGQSNYSAAKAGMIGFTKALAKEAASYGVQVNAIAPGPVDTGMLDGLTEETMDRLISNVPLKRVCTVHEVAAATVFLADTEASPDYYTGQVLVLDGGAGL
ncbi:MAG: 3-oxoacyl-ACP reductase FabG [Defluviitaleaceae bacterium]|nr:3-oxoacyl-ACP reductase FabG [Defluviitaleaceae bacterium]